MQGEIIFGNLVDQKSNINEQLFESLHWKDGTSGEALANLIIKQLKLLGIDINYCHGQGYDVMSCCKNYAYK